MTSLRDTDRPIVWVDLETTGLDERRCAVLEVGLVVTDLALVEHARRAWTVRYVGPVSPFIAAMHGPDGSGLLRCILASEQGATAWRGEGLPVDEVDALAAAWLSDVCDGVAPLWGGRNVAFDRRWCRAHLPRLHDAVAHRSLDETTLRIVLDAWAGVVVPKDATPQGNRHRALDDLDECLRVARAFRAAMAGRPSVAGTCPPAPRQARGLRGATLRRLLGNKCPVFHHLYDLRPNTCATRGTP